MLLVDGSIGARAQVAGRIFRCFTWYAVICEGEGE